MSQASIQLPAAAPVAAATASRARDRRAPASVARQGSEVLVEDVTLAPLWLDDAPAKPALSERPPSQVDVVVVGAGYTGLNAAIEIARSGRSVVVLEKGALDDGCSAKNGGQISTSVKPSRAALAKRFGDARARAMRQEGVAALDWLEAFVTREGLDCDFHRSGRFFAAHSPEHYDALARAAEIQTREEGAEAVPVPRAEQRSELGTDFYHGGVVYPRNAALHPAKYHRELARLAVASGVEIVAECPASGIASSAAGFRVTTPFGAVEARDVVVATNGYTTALTPWLRRRVIPIGSYVIATEPLSPALVDTLFPTNRMVCDTRRVVYYYRLSPDRRRIVFGGRVAARETDPLASGPLLHAEMRRIFPELAQARISHSWLGFVAYTFDELAHIGAHEGVHYAMGYCGSGVSMASYLGMRLGRRVLGREDGRTAFDDAPFQTRPGYRGDPWFLPAAVGWRRWRDRLDCRRAARAATPIEPG